MPKVFNIPESFDVPGISEAVDVDAMRRIVEFLTTLCPPRNATFPQALNAAAAYIVQ